MDVFRNYYNLYNFLDTQMDLLKFHIVSSVMIRFYPSYITEDFVVEISSKIYDVVIHDTRGYSLSSICDYVIDNYSIIKNDTTQDILNNLYERGR